MERSRVERCRSFLNTVLQRNDAQQTMQSPADSPMGSANSTSGAFTGSVASWALPVWILSLLGQSAPILLLVLVPVLLLLPVLQMLGRHLQAPRA